MSLKDRWYMWRDANGKRLEHNPMGYKMFSHKCKCLKCGYEWISTVNRAKRCPNGECQTVNWDVEPEEKYIPLPVFNHKERKPLKCLNGRCPYCGGTTGIDSRVLFCYSCDQTWNIVTRDPLGIVKRINEQ